MSYGNPHNLVIPTVGVTPGPTAAAQINTALQTLQTTLDAKVTPGGIDINTDLSYRSGAVYYGAKDLHRAAFQQQALLSAVTYPSTVFVGTDGELYYNDLAGRQIRITQTGSVSAASGNISGLVAPADLNWSPGDNTFYHYSAAGVLAHVAARNLRMSDASGNFLTQTAAAMISDYTVTWPAAVPAANGSFVFMDISGQLGTTRAVSAASVTTDVSGSVTLGSGGHVTVSGAGRLKHGTLAYVVNATTGRVSSGGGSPTFNNTNVTSTSPNDEIVIPVQMVAGQRITSVTAYIINGGANRMDFTLTRFNTVTAVNTNVVLWSAASGAGYQQATSGAITETVQAEYVYSVFCDFDTTGDVIYSVSIQYDTP